MCIIWWRKPCGRLNDSSRIGGESWTCDPHRRWFYRDHGARQATSNRIVPHTTLQVGSVVRYLEIWQIKPEIISDQRADTADHPHMFTSDSSQISNYMWLFASNLLTASHEALASCFSLRVIAWWHNQSWPPILMSLRNWPSELTSRCSIQQNISQIQVRLAFIPQCEGGPQTDLNCKSFPFGYFHKTIWGPF